jgi:DNA-binding SARP family transcriptional activator/tetratricopeptide (TPR) repeat protein
MAAGARVTLRTRKHVALLYFLAHHAGRPVAREQVVELLWSEDAPQRAKHSLSQSVSLINKALGSEVILQAGRDRLLLAEGTLRLDVAEFEHLVAEGRMDEARALWHGPLFEGLWLRRAPQFEEWLGKERARLLRVLRQAVHVELDLLRKSGDHGRRRIEAERMLELDPLDERAMLAWLEAVTLGGDRALALRRYGEFAQRLREEVDAEPSAALSTWAKRQRKGEGEPAPAINRLHEVTVLPTVEPVYGRAEEFGHLWSAWEQARGGHGRMVILQGESGIGKSALVNLLANQVHVGGSSVAFVRCYRIEKAVPFAPLSALIRQLARLPGFVATSPTWIGELTRLVPELRERYPHVPHPMAIDDSARYRLSDATVQTATSVAEEQPLLIVVDDIHDADEATLAALHYLGRQTPTLPLLMVVVHRPSPDATEYERVFVETARAAGFGECLVVPSLSTDSTEKIVTQILARRGLNPPSELVRQLALVANGNPLAARDLAFSATMISDGRTDGPRSTLTLNGRGTDDSGESIAARIGQLDDLDRRLALTIAVAGRPLSDHDLASMLELKLGALCLSLTRLEAGGFVRREGNAIWFAHDRYTTAVLESEPEAALRDTHARVASFLDSQTTNDPSARHEVARHYEAAGMVAEAARSARDAAVRAAALGAIQARAKALEVLRQTGADADAGVTLELAKCHLELNELDVVERLCNDLESKVSAADPAMEDVAFLRLSSMHESGDWSFQEVQDGLEQVVLQPVVRGRFRHEALLLLARTADKTGSYDVARLAARRLRIMEREGDQEARAYSLFASGYVFTKYYDPRRAIPLLERCIQVCQESSNWILEQAAHETMGIALKQAGRFEQSLDEIGTALAMARMMMNPHGELRALQNRAVSEMVLGRWDATEASLQEAQRIPRLRWGYAPNTDYNLGLLRLLTGNPGDALRHFDNVVKAARAAGFPSLAADATAASALAFEQLGDEAKRAQAVAELDAIEPDADATRQGWIAAAARVAHLAASNHAREAVESGMRLVALLKRRDVANWLALCACLANIRDGLDGGRMARDEVERLATHYRAASARALLR